MDSAWKEEQMKFQQTQGLNRSNSQLGASIAQAAAAFEGQHTVDVRESLLGLVDTAQQRMSLLEKHLDLLEARLAGLLDKPRGELTGTGQETQDRPGALVEVAALVQRITRASITIDELIARVRL